MSNNSEKGNKTWKVVARFLLPPAILVSFLIPILIQIVEAGHSDLLEFIIIDNQIIAIITLLASVSLSVFLIQRYMNTKPKWADKIWKNFSQFLLLFVLLMSVFISIKMLIQIVGTWYPELLKYLTVFKDKPIIAIITLLASVSLSSFLLQVYMIIDPEKSNKTKGQTIAWCLLQPTLLISVLISVPILIVETWHPQLLELKFLGGIIPDEQAYRQIITLITLLASVSLLSFLLQIYMNTDSEKGDKIWKIVAYPVHGAFRLTARFAILMTVLIPISIVLISIVSVWVLVWKPIKVLDWIWNLKLLQILRTAIIDWVWNLELLQILRTAIIYWIWNPVSKVLAWVWNLELLQILRTDTGWADIHKIIALLITVGLIPLLLGKKLTTFKQPILTIKNKIVEGFKGSWLPKIDIRKSLSGTWCYVEKVWWPSMRDTFTESRKLVFPVLMLCFIFFCGYVSVISDPNKEWRSDVTGQLGTIRAETDTIKTDTDAIRAETANLIILRSSGLSPAYLSKNKGDISFLLIYPSQGDLESNKGICPADSSLNLEWLKFFKKAFSACAEDSLKLKIQGFASAAPVAERDSSKYQKEKSDSFNREIANQRAEALIYFLTLADNKTYNLDSCKVALKDSSRWGRVKGKPHTFAWRESDFAATYEDSPYVQWKGPHFTVAYKPWENHDEMAKAKPVQDSLRLDLEFLNRSVKITIAEDSCLTKAVPASQ